jgi:hypothetical protein
MTIEYRKPNDTTIYTEKNVINLYVGQNKDGYFLNYNVEDDNQDRIVCPVKLDSIKMSV